MIEFLRLITITSALITMVAILGEWMRWVQPPLSPYSNPPPYEVQVFPLASIAFTTVMLLGLYARLVWVERRGRRHD